MTVAKRHKVLRAVGGGVLGATALIAAAGDFLFHFSLDNRAPLSMMKLVSSGRIQGAALEGRHRDADEEREAARWFGKCKRPVHAVSEDGLHLHGWMLPPLDGTDETVANRYAICCHGYTGRPRDMAKYAYRLSHMGFAVLAPAQRCHELSEGRFVGMGWLERRDLVAWARMLARRNPDASILLFGVSMGAATVMMASGEPDLPSNVAAGVEDCGYSSVWEQFMDNALTLYHMPARWTAAPVLAAMSVVSRLRAGYGFRQASCIRQLKRCRIPMLFIHGSADTFVNPAAVDANFAVCAGAPRLRLLVPGAGHAMSASTDPALYWKTVEEFVTRVRTRHAMRTPEPTMGHD
ncbi:alpha/beta hydrolase [Bifidobacterium avesanii]|uniref:Alpha/beta hydrolase n=1 Tax=Bifidobacterium avesanii TaxID=1798157 RepID=A0A7K3TER2_9BIFI|nr:alpha/beta hydrolase [Bifidobacterium avesanii]KAB8295581.1 alpha/beta hydrolase [Bifidobacterium avesanii]NEG77585.1 alpha/beta hydrolase [Bifidobacterium avesanii]